MLFDSCAPRAAQAGFNAVTLTGGMARCYHANGNEIRSSDGREIDYDIANLPTKIAIGLDSTEFRYRPSGTSGQPSERKAERELRDSHRPKTGTAIKGAHGWLTTIFSG